MKIRSEFSIFTRVEPDVPQFLIYGMVDPRTRELRYIGQTKRGIRRISEFHSGHCKFWQRQLANLGLKPLGVVIEKLEDGADIASRMNSAEIGYIDFFKSVGCRLTNLTEGADGNIHKIVTDETRRKLSLAIRGRKLTPEWKHKISLAHRGKKISLETRARQSAALKGRPHTAEHNAKVSAALIAYHQNKKKAKS